MSQVILVEEPTITLVTVTKATGVVSCAPDCSPDVPSPCSPDEVCGPADCKPDWGTCAPED